MADIVYNGLRPLETAASTSSSSKRTYESLPRTKSESSFRTSAWTQILGTVHFLNSIPFDYKQRHPSLFVKTNGPKDTNIQNRFLKGGGSESGPQTRFTNSHEETYNDTKFLEAFTPNHIEPNTSKEGTLGGRNRSNTSPTEKEMESSGRI